MQAYLGFLLGVSGVQSLGLLVPCFGLLNGEGESPPALESTAVFFTPSTVFCWLNNASSSVKFYKKKNEYKLVFNWQFMHEKKNCWNMKQSL